MGQDREVVRSGNLAGDDGDKELARFAATIINMYKSGIDEFDIEYAKKNGEQGTLRINITDVTERIRIPVTKG